MDYLEQSQAAGRQVMPDLARAIALIGIAVVNVAVISYPLMGGYIHGGLNTSIDNFAYFLVNSLFLMKFYTLFFFMFGVGFAFQMKSAARTDAGFTGRYFRRIIGLLILGLFNIALLYQGDILVLYAILGSLLFLFRKASTRTLMKWGVGFFVLQILVFLGITVGVYLGQKYTPDDMALEAVKMAETVVRSHAVYGFGSFTEAIALRLQEWSEIIRIGIFLDGPGAMAFFLFGFAAVKSNVISNAQASTWRRFRRTFLPIGLIGSAIGAYVQSLSGEMLNPVSMLGMSLIAFFALFSTAGYLGLIAKWASGPATKVKLFMARGGTATLTAYLLQGLLLSLIFNAYGLGLFAKLDAVYCILIALAVSVFTIILASLWRAKFARGPFEYGLRKFTYLGNRQV